LFIWFLNLDLLTSFASLFREGNEVFSFDVAAEDFGLFVFEISF